MSTGVKLAWPSLFFSTLPLSTVARSTILLRRKSTIIKTTETLVISLWSLESSTLPPSETVFTMTSTIGIPIKLLNEAQVSLDDVGRSLSLQICAGTLADIYQGHVITLEITSGQVYRGKLLEGTLCRQGCSPQ